MTNHFAHSVSIVLAAGAAAIAAAPASATEYDGARSVVVRHSDLDLATERGVGQLNRRIATASRMVCGSFEPVDLRAKANVLACREAAIAASAVKVELAVAAARSGQQFAARSIAVGNAVP